MGDKWYTSGMGMLSIVSTPIGNLDDITIRAIKTLFTADAILCEDTRRSSILLTTLASKFGELFDQNPDWKPKLLPYYEEIEEKKLPEYITLLMNGSHLALITDAGTPIVSDPGFRLVRECIKRTIPVISVPGPSAVLTALTSSGLPADKFTFLGYPPEKSSARITLFKNLSSVNVIVRSTYIFYCAPHKLEQTLKDLQASIALPELVIARELTKIHEEVWKGTIDEALTHFQNPKGEIVLVFSIP